MNSTIERIFNGFTVDGTKIPVSFVYYEGHDEPFITYQQIDADGSFSADDDIQGLVLYYDFDVYSKTDYTSIIDGVKELLTKNGWKWQPNMSSMDMYETDTGYYHRTLCFAVLKEEN
jgi:hypothetical protein